MHIEVVTLHTALDSTLQERRLIKSMLGRDMSPRDRWYELYQIFGGQLPKQDLPADWTLAYDDLDRESEASPNNSPYEEQADEAQILGRNGDGDFILRAGMTVRIHKMAFNEDDAMALQLVWEHELAQSNEKDEVHWPRKILWPRSGLREVRNIPGKRRPTDRMTEATDQLSTSGSPTARPLADQPATCGSKPEQNVEREEDGRGVGTSLLDRGYLPHCRRWK